MHKKTKKLLGTYEKSTYKKGKNLLNTYKKTAYKNSKKLLDTSKKIVAAPLRYKKLRWMWDAEFWINQKVKIIFLLLTFFILIYFIIVAIKGFYAEEKFPPIVYNVPKKEVQFGRSAALINVGFYVRDFLHFDINRGIFEIDAHIWFEFDPDLVSLDTLSKFKISNTIEDTEFKKVPLSTKFIKEDGKMLAVYAVKARYFNKLQYHRFPFSDHRIFFVLDLPGVTPDVAHFDSQSSAVRLRQGLSPGGWKLIAQKVKSGYVLEKLDHTKGEKHVISYPRVIVGFDFFKPGIRKILIILGPSLILFFFGLLPLTFVKFRGTSLATGSLTGLVLNRLVIENVSPDIGYFSLIDYIYIYFISVVFVVLVVLTFETRLVFLKKIKTQFLYSAQILSLIIFYYLLWEYGIQ